MTMLDRFETEAAAERRANQIIHEEGRLSIGEITELDTIPTCGGWIEAGRPGTGRRRRPKKAR